MGRLTCSAAALLLAASLFAQAPASDAVAHINNIKSQSDIYLYAESTAQTWQDALDNAKYLLEVEVESWAKETAGQEDVSAYVLQMQNDMLEIQSMRGSRYRAFVYVKKTDIVPYPKKDNLMIVPANRDGAQVRSVKPEEKGGKEEAQQPAPRPDNNRGQFVIQGDDAPEKPALTPIEQGMLSVKKNTEIGTYITRLKKEGKSVQHGKYSEMPDGVECRLFVYNREGNIVACLLRKADGSFRNLKTGQPDDIQNYHGCGGYWFLLK